MAARFLMTTLLLATAVVLFADAANTEDGVLYYSSKYDNINADEILRNPRLRTNYLNCYLSKSRCTSPDMKFFKEVFPEALVTRCKRCTEKQKELFEKVTVWFAENEPDTWNNVVAKTIEDVRRKKGQ